MQKKRNYGPWPLWTPEEDQVLLDNLDRARKGGQAVWAPVAVQLGRTYGAVRMRVTQVRRQQSKAA